MRNGAAAQPQLITDSPAQTPLWELACASQGTHRFSTLFTAQDVRERLSSDAGLDRAVQWCKDTGVTKVYVEEFRDGYQPEKATLLKAKQRFEK